MSGWQNKRSILKLPNVFLPDFRDTFQGKWIIVVQVACDFFYDKLKLQITNPC